GGEAAAEVEGAGAGEVAGDDHVRGRVHRDAGSPGHVRTRERPAPGARSAGGELGDEGVLAARVLERAAAEVDRGAELSGDQGVPWASAAMLVASAMSVLAAHMAVPFGSSSATKLPLRAPPPPLSTIVPPKLIEPRKYPTRSTLPAASTAMLVAFAI